MMVTTLQLKNWRAKTKAKLLSLIQRDILARAGIGDWNQLASGGRLAISTNLLEDKKIGVILARMNLFQNSADSRPIRPNHHEQITSIKT